MKKFDVINPSFFSLSILMACIIYVVYFYQIDFYQPPEKSKDTPDFMFENIRVSHINNGELEVEVYASHASIYKDDQRIILEGTSGRIFSKGNNYLLFNSPNSLFNLNSQSLKLFDAYSVYVNNGDFVWINSDYINWDPFKKNVLANGNVSVYLDAINIFSDDINFNIMDNIMIIDGNSKMYIDSKYNET